MIFEANNHTILDGFSRKGVAMDKEWTLCVKNFAKIEIAEVKISPLMCFVGDNNSGKSYLMSLLWGILTLGKEVFPKLPSEAKIYKRCENWLKENLNQDTELTEEIIGWYILWFNDLLSVNKKLLLQKIFNYEVAAEKIEICNYHRRKKIEIRWEEAGERYSVTDTYVKFPKKEVYSKEEILRMNAYICWNLLMEGIAAPLYTPIVKGRRMGEPVYLPASRTGFMLTYSQLIENSLQISFTPAMQENSSTLTLPYVDFLQLITKFETKGKAKGKKEWVVEYIETQMTKGNLTVKKDMVPLIQYCPDGIEKPLPLFVASSIVTEISPLLLLFKSNINFKTLIVEEPEAHLHPELQQKMARLIINLVNRGIPVWITTHSDTMLQHINNMLKLKRHENVAELMQEYNYTKNDLLNEKDVSMYQFDQCENGKTRLEQLEATQYGFAVPTFNNALEKILGEVYAFQED